MKISVIGTGFVGVVTAAVMASLGNQVIGIDIDERKIASLKQGIIPFFEPDLPELLQKQISEGRLTFSTDYAASIPDSELIIVCVGTPSASDGQADLRALFGACESAAEHFDDEVILAIKSTVPPGTFTDLSAAINQKTSKKYYLASLPEFLREGKAVADTLKPDRIVIGCDNQAVVAKLIRLHEQLGAPIVNVGVETAQMAKYAANAYLATRITFINQIANLCEKNGADIQGVIQAIGYDQRIGSHYWYPGLGYGGSCFPKDVRELSAYAKSVGEVDNLLTTINQLNEQRLYQILDRWENKLGSWSNKRVAVLGLAFKPHTNDMREAPSIRIIPTLLEKGATIIGYDPQALSSVEMFIKSHQNAHYTDNLDQAVADVDVIMALTEWPEIINHSFAAARRQDRQQWFFDARNQFDPQLITGLGYNYSGIARGNYESVAD